jgi:homoserine kinase
MGCGSSAAGRLAAIALAVHFGQLDWDTDRILEEAYKLEGHPDNVAACWLGGFVAAVCEGTRVYATHVNPPGEWRAIVALPAEPLATSKARAVLPASYSLPDVVANLQAVATLGLAFAQGRGDLLRLAMNDRIHQPYRAPYCSLLLILTPLVGENGILGVTLSGAGPAVLMVLDSENSVPDAVSAARKAIGNRMETELTICRFSGVGASQVIESK